MVKNRHISEFYTCFTHGLFFVEAHDLEHIPLFVNYEISDSAMFLDIKLRA